jgi:hypothetical protein
MIVTGTEITRELEVMDEKHTHQVQEEDITRTAKIQARKTTATAIDAMMVVLANMAMMIETETVIGRGVAGIAMRGTGRDHVVGHPNWRGEMRWQGKTDRWSGSVKGMGGIDGPHHLVDDSYELRGLARRWSIEQCKMSANRLTTALQFIGHLSL